MLRGFKLLKLKEASSITKSIPELHTEVGFYFCIFTQCTNQFAGEGSPTSNGVASAARAAAADRVEEVFGVAADGAPTSIGVTIAREAAAAGLTAATGVLMGEPASGFVTAIGIIAAVGLATTSLSTAAAALVVAPAAGLAPAGKSTFLHPTQPHNAEQWLPERKQSQYFFKHIVVPEHAHFTTSLTALAPFCETLRVYA